MRGHLANVASGTRCPGIEGGMSKHLPAQDRADIRRRECSTRRKACRSAIVAARSKAPASVAGLGVPRARAPRRQGGHQSRASSGIDARTSVGWALLPMQFKGGRRNRPTLKLDGTEKARHTGVAPASSRAWKFACRAIQRARRQERGHQLLCSIDTLDGGRILRHGWHTRNTVLEQHDEGG